MNRAISTKRASLKRQLKQIAKKRQEKQDEMNSFASELYQKGITDYGKNKTLLKQNRELDALILKEMQLKEMLEELK